MTMVHSGLKGLTQHNFYQIEIVSHKSKHIKNYWQLLNLQQKNILTCRTLILTLELFASFYISFKAEIANTNIFKLTLEALKYFCINHGDRGIFCQFEIIINVLVSYFRFFEYMCNESINIISNHHKFSILSVRGSTINVRFCHQKC